MKKMLIITLSAIAGAFILPTNAKAQQDKPYPTFIESTDTSKNADTVIVDFKMIPSNVVSFTCTVKKISGSPSGYVLLQGSNITGSWDDLNTDTLFVTNSAVCHKTWVNSSTNYASYRAWYKSTSTQQSVLSFLYLRRPKIKVDE